MKKFLSILLVGFMVVTTLPISAALAEDVVYQENVIDKISDWAQTVGKDKTERDQILAKNKAERQKKHVAKMVEQRKKQAEKKAQQKKKEAEEKIKQRKADAAKAKKDAKKKFGL